MWAKYTLNLAVNIIIDRFEREGLANWRTFAMLQVSARADMRVTLKVFDLSKSNNPKIVSIQSMMS
jgi:hypothetical protein